MAYLLLFDFGLNIARPFMMVRIAFLILLITYSSRYYSQEYPQDYFRSPLDIPLFLSGNFGELRSNHFHAGLDIKTQGVVGQKVYAVADGYVSRIKVSPYGYGNALYITHPNGYTSVYGHLKKYNDKITKVVKTHQYKKESFAVQLFPTPFSMPVKKGDIIAYSGNSGGSGGPHLHFEIRNTDSEHPYNPLFFGFDIKDHIKPDIYAITIYPLNDTSFVNGQQSKLRFRAKGVNGKYQLLHKNQIKVYGEIGFGIETVDRMNGTGNSYGLHNIQLSIDDKLVYEHQIDEFAFHEGRYINSHIDYETYVKRRRRVQKTFVQEGNKLRIYKNIENKGRYIFNSQGSSILSYKVIDAKGNHSTLRFQLTTAKVSLNKRTTVSEKKDITFFKHRLRNTLLRENILFDVPKGVLYEDLLFEFKVDSATQKTISPIYWLHNHYTPLHSYATVSIKMQNLSNDQKQKSLIVSTVDKKSWYPEGGSWKGDNISVKTRSLGGYAVALDTVAPKIIPINIYSNANMSNKWSISIKVTDNLSEVDYYRGSIDGKWILMEYDAKNDRLTHYFDERTSRGKHQFELVIKDGVGNESKYTANFIR